ncbi:MAG: radical SAM protein, partial [Bacteroides sp. SM1_62]
MKPVVSKALLIYPRFTFPSFWNYRKTCELLGACYPAAPLGMATVAALLPESWDLRLIDCNVEELTERDIKWADIVLSGGMISQQIEHIKLIEKIKSYNRVHVVGGPDVTSSPHLYDKADHLVLGEAEITLPEFLKDLVQAKTKHLYTPGDEKADISVSPIPRFDLLKFDRYLHVGIQFSRGCPFNCEFCDIIELFGRSPRTKTPKQIISEIQRLYDLGYRGHIDIVDDNFISHKKDVKILLPKMESWQRK